MVDENKQFKAKLTVDSTVDLQIKMLTTYGR